MAVAGRTGLFADGELETLEGMVADYFDGRLSDDHHWVVDDDDGIKGAAYCASEVMADGVFNLLFIGVEPDARRQGRGDALLGHMEDWVRAQGARLLLIETSSLERFAPAWACYRKNGFEEEARIRGYYSASDDKIIFRKELAGT